MKNPTTPNSLSRRDLLKRGSAVALGAAVGSQAITGFPTIWAQNIKNVTEFGTGVSNINAIAQKAKEDLVSIWSSQHLILMPLLNV